jgi:hypothetical protein
MDWRGGSSSREPALQEFEPQSHQKKKKPHVRSYITCESNLVCLGMYVHVPMAKAFQSQNYNLAYRS